MIRNVVLIELRPGTDPAAIAALGAALAAIEFPERTNFSFGADLALREGNFDVAVLADFPDEDSYRRFDADESHNAVRSEHIAPIAARVARCQYRVD